MPRAERAAPTQQRSPAAHPALQPASAGEPLEPSLRAALEPRFDHDFGQVRVHASSQAEAIGARAYTVGQDVVFAPGQFRPDTPRGRHLLAHELTHTVQNAHHPEAADSAFGLAQPRLARTTDASELEANRAAREVTRGASVQVQQAPGASVAPLFGWVEDAADWVSDTASSAWDSTTEAVSDAGSWIADTASDAGSAIASGAGAAWDATKGAGSYIYDGMKQNAGYVRDGVKWAEGGIDWLEGQASSGAHWLADKAEGIPVLEQLAAGGAWAVDQQAQFTGGALKGATTLLGGVGQMIADPVDTVIGLEAMAEHARLFPGMPNPLQVAHGLYNAATTDATLAGEMNRTLNPVETMKGDLQFGKALVGGLLEPYKESWAQGKYAEVGGRAAFDIGSLFIGAGEANAAVKGAEGAALAGDAARAAELAEAARAAAGAGDAAKAAELAEAAKAAEAAEAARAAEAAEAAKLAEGADAAHAGGGGAGKPPAQVPPGGGGGPGPKPPLNPEVEQMLDEVEREGRATRTKDIRAKAREVKSQELGELRDQGLVNDEFVELADDIGLDNAEALAEGEIGFKEAGSEVSHEPFPLAEGPEYGDKASNLRARGKAAHREGMHGRQFNKGSEFQPVDPRHAEHAPFQSVPERGKPPLSPNEMDEALEAGAQEQWADREAAMNEAIDRSRNPEAVTEALNGGKAPGKGRGGPKLSEAERAARETEALDRSILGEYNRPNDFFQGLAREAPEKAAEALEWLRKNLGGG